MAWSTIRKATEEDTERLQIAATRFLERHQDEMPYLKLDAEDLQDPVFTVTFHTDWDESMEDAQRIPRRRLARLWTRCQRRALRHPHADGIAYGYVGQHVD
jgi:hypothetical protein